MNTLILGGIKSGKSQLAEQLAEQSCQPITLIATATAQDDEMRKRIQRHRTARPKNWRVIEEPIKIGSALTGIDHTHCVIVDCLTLWLTNLLLLHDEEVFLQERADLLNAVESSSSSLIVVSNETSMGIVPTGELTRRYCDEIGMLHQELGRLSRTVVLVVAGLPHCLKGEI